MILDSLSDDKEVPKKFRFTVAEFILAIGFLHCISPHFKAVILSGGCTLVCASEASHSR